MAQDARGKLQEARESLAFLQGFLSETQPVAATRDAQMAETLEQAAEPHANLSAKVIRRVIARVECIA